MSVCQVTETTLYYRGLPASGGLLDPLMGSVDRRHLCATCTRDARLCQGHPGHIVLAFPVYHYGFMDTVLKTLRTVCFCCSRLCTTDEDARSVANLAPQTRFQTLHSLLRNRKHCPYCHMTLPNYTRYAHGIHVEWPEDMVWESDEERQYCTRPFTAREALSILRYMKDDDVTLLGFDTLESHPMHMIIQNVVVPPPCTRPAIYSSEGSRSRGQNDLTVRLMEILKRSHEIQNVLGAEGCGTAEVTPDLLERIHRLQYEVFILVNNSKRIQRPVGMGRTTGGQNTKSLTDRLRGKEGRVRGNLMGKRVDFSARCVITPDAYFDCDRVGVPYDIALRLTIPETVNATNVHSLSERVRAGSNTLAGAQNLILCDGTVINLANCKERSEIILRPGDVVERYLMDDDVVVFNRQPSLHMHSMQCHRVRLMPGHTFRLSLNVAAPYNADFDGDEMNLHVPQSKVAAAECAALMAVTQNCISAQANKPVIGIVQDSLLGLHLLSNKDILFDHPHACRLLGGTRYCPKRLPSDPALVLVNADGTRRGSLWTGKQMFSCLLPRNMHVDGNVLTHVDVLRSDAHEEDEWPVVIRDGRLLCGELRKAHVGTTAGGLIDIFCREYGNVAAMRFMGDVQRLTHSFLLQRGHHVGIQDVMLSSAGQVEVSDRLSKASRLCEEIQGDIQDAPTETVQKGEKAILHLLSKMLLQTGGIVNEHMSKRNSIRRMVKAGSKGSFINLSQIAACLGQQSLEGARITAEKGNRTLPCFAEHDVSLASRGMVYNSFALGLTPPELFYHAIGGREGLVDTAVKTSATGYLQRRMNKSMEDHRVDEDGIVRDALGNIINFSWGSDGFHPARVERVKLDILKQSEAVLETWLTSRERDVFLPHRARVLRVKTNLLVSEMDLRVVLPFQPKRILYAMTREEKTTEPRISAELVWTRLQSLLALSPSSVLALALVETFCVAHSGHLSEAIHLKYVEQCRNRIEHAMSTHGESVGCIAAQSIGEPATQMTLNTFHTAGVSAKNVTLGIPRLKELLDGSKCPKTPCTTLRFHPPFCKSRTFVEYVANTLPLTRLVDVISECDIHYDPEPRTTVVHGDEWIVATDVLLTPREYDGCSRHVLRFKLHREVIKAKHLTPPLVRRVLEDRLGARAIVQSSETNALEWVVRVRYTEVEDMVARGGLDRDHELILCQRGLNILLDTVVLGGHPSVVSANATHVTTYAPSLEETMEHVVHVYGSFLSECAGCECVDWTHCTSNDIWEVKTVLGIEACAHVFFEQIKAVVSFDGTYVDERHLSVLVDTVCRGGTIMPLTRHGINRTDVSPLMRCSFEETTDVLCNAAMHSESENAKGVTTSIMTGQLANFGTGHVNVLFPMHGVGMTKSGRRVLRSTCRSYVRPAITEVMEYIVDETQTIHSRSEDMNCDVFVRTRARFRLVSPPRSRPDTKD